MKKTTRMRVVGFEWILASKLKPHPSNWRIHSDAQKTFLSAMLADVGFAGGLVVRKHPDEKGFYQILDGHMRQAGMDPATKLPCLIVDLTDAEVERFLATYDPISALAFDSENRLAQSLASLNLPGNVSDMLRLYLESQSDLQSRLASLTPPPPMPEDPGVEIDKADELQKKWKTKRGQIWLVGKHRLMCGDSTTKKDMMQLLDGKRVQLIFTDPPYGVSIGKKNRLLNSVQPSGRNLTDIEDDALSPKDLKAKLLPAFVNMRVLAMAQDCSVFLTAPQGGEIGMMMMMMKEAGLPVRHIIIWKKNSPTFSMGRLDYDYQHEPILFTWLKKHKRPMLGQHRTSVWEIDKPRASPDHPTMKPIELYENALLNNSDKNDSALDAYAGAGPMFVACERQERQAYGMEISPGYVAVTLERMSKMGLTPELT